VDPPAWPDEYAVTEAYEDLLLRHEFPQLPPDYFEHQPPIVRKMHLEYLAHRRHLERQRDEMMLAAMGVGRK